MVDIWRVAYDDLWVRDYWLLLWGPWGCCRTKATSPTRHNILWLVLIRIKLILWITEPSATTPSRVLSRWYPISDGLLVLIIDPADSGHPLLLALRCEPVLVHLPIVVEIIEHQVEVVVNFLRKMINDSFLTVDHYLHVVLLDHWAAPSDYACPCMVTPAIKFK